MLAKRLGRAVIIDPGNFDEIPVPKRRRYRYIVALVTPIAIFGFISYYQSSGINEAPAECAVDDFQNGTATRVKATANPAPAETIVYNGITVLTPRLSVQALPAELAAPMEK